VGRALVIALLALGCSPAEAQTEPPALPAEVDPQEQVHWAVGAFFGTGWYKVDDNRSVFVLRIQPRHQIRDPVLLDSGERRLGVEILYPVSLGFSQLEDIPDFVEFDNYATISFTPGVEVEVPVNPRWSLRPFAHLGYGWEFESQEGAFIGYGGIKSRYRLSDDRLRWSLLNGLYYAGYRPEYEDRGQYGALMAGLEFSQPLSKLRQDGDALFLNWHLTYNWYFDRLNFHSSVDDFASFRDQWELGLAIAKRDQTLDFGFLSFEQIGLALRWSSDGSFNAITVNFRSPFTN
jgi:hypothetical protein